MEVSGPASSAVGRPLTEDEMADVKKEASAGPDSGRGAARCEAEAPLERAGGASQRGVPRRVPGQRAGQGRAGQGRAERGGGGPETRGSAPADLPQGRALPQSPAALRMSRGRVEAQGT